MAWKDTLHRWMNENVADTREAGGPAGRLYTVPFARVWDTLLEYVQNRPRWTLTHKDESLGILTVCCRTPVVRFVDDLSIWVALDENGLTRVEARSRSRVGKGDWGVNRRRIERLLRKLDRSLGPRTRLLERREQPRETERAASAVAHRVFLLVLAGGLAAAAFPADAGAGRDSFPALSVPGARGDTIAWLDAFRADGELGEWNGLEPMLGLSSPGNGESHGWIWVGQTAEGLAIAGRVRSGGVELSLADGRELTLPPIGWGHQFGFEKLESEEGCGEIAGDVDACRAWYQAQVVHRERLAGLFVHRWVLFPDSVTRLGASVAFAALTDSARGVLAPLTPSERALVSAWSGTDDPNRGHALELLVPWEALPPVRGLIVDALRVGVALPGSDRDTLSGERTVYLPRPREYFLSPCRYGTETVVLESDSLVYFRVPSEDAVRYIRPGSERDLRSLLLLDNVAAGYQYEPYETSLSPAVFEARYYTRRLADDELLCGPVLAHRRGDRVSSTVDSTHANSQLRSGGADMVVPEFYLEPREHGDSGLLIKEGPRVFFSYYGSGQCGACPRIGLDIYHVDRRSGEITAAFSYTRVVDYRNVDILVSEDWREVTVFEAPIDMEEPEQWTWRSTRHCLAEGEIQYRVCGERDSVPAPPLRLWEGVWEEPS